MSETTNESGGTGPSHRSMEVSVALFIALLAVVGIIGSFKVGVGWGPDGPRAGFFPFYISMAVLISCAVNLAKVFFTPDEGEIFAEWSQLRQVGAVVLPTAVYVLLVPRTGIYVASALLIAGFMWWFGKYNWLVSIVVALTVMVLIFMMFEMWFLVPLPKGPVENYLGY
jgi:putative tricarboxylic transport membrane protein